VRLPQPGAGGAGFRAGKNTTPEGARPDPLERMAHAKYERRREYFAKEGFAKESDMNPSGFETHVMALACAGGGTLYDSLITAMTGPK